MTHCTNNQTIADSGENIIWEQIIRRAWVSRKPNHRHPTSGQSFRETAMLVQSTIWIHLDIQIHILIVSSCLLTQPKPRGLNQKHRPWYRRTVTDQPPRADLGPKQLWIRHDHGDSPSGHASIISANDAPGLCMPWLRTCRHRRPPGHPR